MKLDQYKPPFVPAHKYWDSVPFFRKLKLLLPMESLVYLSAFLLVWIVVFGFQWQLVSGFFNDILLDIKVKYILVELKSAEGEVVLRNKFKDGGRVDFVFTVDGVEYKSHFYHFDDVNSGPDFVTVKYDPKDPNINMAEGQSRFQGFLFIIFTMVVLVPLSFAIKEIIQLSRTWNLFKEGVLIRAKPLGVSKGRRFFFTPKRNKLVMVFKDPDGKEIKHDFFVGRIDEEMREKDSLVLFHHEDPGKAMSFYQLTNNLAKEIFEYYGESRSEVF